MSSGPPPRRISTDSSTSTALPANRPCGWFMSVSKAVVRTPMRWPVSTIGEYLAGSSLPSTGRFDILVQVLGARAAELGALCGARDRVAEARRRSERKAPEPAVSAWVNRIPRCASIVILGREGGPDPALLKERAQAIPALDRP